VKETGYSRQSLQHVIHDATIPLLKYKAYRLPDPSSLSSALGQLYKITTDKQTSDLFSLEGEFC
jgi:hypothetical protein